MTAEEQTRSLQRDERNERAQRLARLRNRGAVTPAEVQDLSDLEAQVTFDSELTAREDATEAAAQEAARAEAAAQEAK